MNFLNSTDIENSIIPGYDLLTDEEKIDFIKSVCGKQFKQLVEDTIKQYESIQPKWYEWRYVMSGTFDETKQQLYKQFESNKQSFIKGACSNDDYNMVIRQIACHVLTEEYPEIESLSEAEQNDLINAKFSQNLYENMWPLIQSMVQEQRVCESLEPWSQGQVAGQLQQARINGLIDKKQSYIQDWEDKFLVTSLDNDMTQEMKALIVTVSTKKQLKAKENAAKLEQWYDNTQSLTSMFPFLRNYRTSSNQEPIFNQLGIEYVKNRKIISQPDLINENLTINVLFQCLQTINHKRISFINLDAFNKTQAHLAARTILNAYKTKDSFFLNMAVEQWLQTYTNELYTYLIKQLKQITINNKPWKPTKESSIQILVSRSLSYLRQNKTVDTANDYLAKLADAHAFLQATSFASQNDNPFFAILDLYNYKEMYEKFSEIKKIFMSLFQFLVPLYMEYKEIVDLEKNAYKKFFRTLMPILITLAFVVLISLLLAPLVLPELVFTVIFIPTFFIGMVLASQYVNIKNYLYCKICMIDEKLRYGGDHFAIPEFQINNRMLQILGEDQEATIILVRKFYIDELRKCDEIERKYAAMLKKNHILSDEEKQLKQANSDRKRDLCLEWYDIHDNSEISFDKTRQIILNRLQKASNEEYKALTHCLTLKAEQEDIGSFVNEMGVALKYTIAKYNSPSSSDSGNMRIGTTHDLENLTVLETVKKNIGETNLVKDMNNSKTKQRRYQLFSPFNSLQHRQTIENLVVLEDKIATIGFA